MITCGACLPLSRHDHVSAQKCESKFSSQIFPDEEQASANLKILEMARKWKKQKAVVDA
jgi:hypothetical protein